MKILWLCNFMLPLVAEHLGLEATNKEGWLSGLADVVLARQQENEITLAVAFPIPESFLKDRNDICKGELPAGNGTLKFYGFYENTACAHQYDEGLEGRLGSITKDFEPDVVHCFGTEYPHTLAMCRSFPDKSRILIGIQGLCTVCAEAYFANLPKKTVYDVTLRDFLRKDSLIRQQQKFAARGRMEVEAVRLAGNVTGRTAWDKYYTEKWNRSAVYYEMNETLRPDFYEGIWEVEKCIPHSIFVSQGDYPLKGLHYILCALPAIREKYPDVKVYVAGSNPVNNRTWKDRLKLSAYGKYLKQLIRRYGLEKNIEFLGRLQAGQMKEQYLKSHLYVCCSSLENSPNSLGEAMILGVPCISANVGGVPSVFTGQRDGILYEGYSTQGKDINNMRNFIVEQEGELGNVVKSLENSVLEMWNDEEKMKEYCENARKHALKTHDKEENYRRMTEIYASIVLSD